ncbi:hypothetical protein [Leptolyngbya sp. NIES-2104]|uniref:hypothetical protein n=1 Tax=Leptolyngbya sp. NIES-2104 TaxID=1552121 RepID=UPI0006EC435A|nr:hypothetical protein [Leptolyngbya sp. NIES-2104]GAP99449.1 hypothetical protein NIES2104_60100 [Leptolyngbya sp. NIES-2104]
MAASSDDIPFEQALEKVERSLFDLKDRYAQVQRDEQQLETLQERKANLQSQRKSLTLKAELREIEQQLEELELNLESRLFSWSGLKEVFWQAVRFGGLGIAIGWSLAFITLKTPTPDSSTTPSNSLSSP